MSETRRSPFDEAFLTGIDGVTEVVLVRHGQQEHPASALTASASAYVDPPLSELGVRQAVAVGDALASEQIDAVYCSDLRRAHRTGCEVARHHGLQEVVQEELREVDLFYGLATDLPLAQAVDAEAMSAAREHFVRERRWDLYPHVEDLPAFRSRVHDAFRRIVEAHPGGRVAVACHGGVINVICGAVLERQEDMFFRPAHASVSRLAVLGEQTVLRSLGETGHLRAVDPGLVTY